MAPTSSPTLRPTRADASAGVETELPPLENGDRLSVPEFERRYAAMPAQTKAELLEGIVYMPSPVSNRKHGRPNHRLDWWLGLYIEATPGTDAGTNSSIRFAEEDQPQPDSHLRVLPEFGGRAAEDAAGYLLAAPEWIGEVSSSTVSYDLGVKLRVYQRREVREYLVWRVGDQELDWFVLTPTQVGRLPLSEGVLRSLAFPGLWLDPVALLRDDKPAIRRTLAAGLASPEHAAFVAELARRRAALASSVSPAPTAT